MTRNLRLLLPFLSFTIMLWPACEAALWVAEKSGAAWANLPPDYPSDPDDCVKIAIFGDSAAKGYASVRPPEALLKLELERRYPGKRFFIRNYASPGQPFRDFQAELLKHELDRYDAALVYAAFAEPMRYIDDSGILRPPEEKAQKALTPPVIPRRLIERMKARSRAYRLAWKVKAWKDSLLSRPLDPLVTPNRFRMPPDALQTPLFPEAEKAAMTAGYRNAMDLVGEAAARMKKPVLVGGVIVNEPWGPFVSAPPKALPPGKNAELAARIGRAYELLAAGRAREARSLLASAPPGVAAVDHALGRAELALGNLTAARRRFRLSLDEDGLPLRYAPRLNAAVQAAASNSSGYLRYVDNDAPFETLLRRGYRYEEFFADMEHPNLLGHAFLASRFACALAQAGVVPPPPSDCAAPADPRADAAAAYAALAVTPAEEAEAALQSASWHYSVASLSSRPRGFLDAAELKVAAHEAADGSVHGRVRRILMRAWLEKDRSRRDRATALLNEAARLEPAFVKGQWLLDLGKGQTMRDLFARDGIFWRDGAFSLVDPSSTKSL